MVEKGQRINERYEIICSIGEGGMANVYLAYDIILERKVAVKILRGDLAEDEKFVRRFQREAISASSLNHPNIVEVYDVGEDNGKYFIVMEYVEGKTLKQLIKKRGALTLAEVVDIMLQLTSAIAHAHSSYIIHRDIKPQNVIILEDGRVKIMDFGIAAQLNSGELTQTNSVMGTVYYLPPEQANGNATTTKSDIYSLGILMYELVVGKVPFRGESPVEVAIKQMKESIPDIVSYNPDIPQSIENIILRAAAKNPKNRYETAMEMHEDLKTALDKDRFNEAKVVYEYPESNFDEKEEPMPKRTRRRERETKEEDKKEKKLNKKIFITGIIAGVLFLIAIFTFFIFPALFEKRSIEIPDVSGMTVTKAENKLEEAGFEVATKIKKEVNDKVEEGKVIETDPSAGRTIKKGSKIKLIVSKGSKKLTIEDYTGKDYYEIKGKLEAYGIEVSTEKKDVEDNGKTKANTILSQDVKAGEKLGKGDILTLTIPNLYETYPDFAKDGYSVVDVKKFCTDNDITLEIKYQSDVSHSNGEIIYQNMVAGTKVNKGATLTITVVKNEEKKDTKKEEKTEEES
ncbi:MAG: Stk1 family PASTA domain-containing Ser/Thr kinase [Bacilli bacterium]|nr:Stk1 family PASTA domain-containing Ser/Thr kinase [Bacilli bacterium]